MRKDTISRSQLISGMLATGAFAACGGGASPSAPAANPTTTPLCPAVLNTVGVDQIFSDPVFNGLDKAAIAKLFDPTPQIEANNQGYFSQTGEQIQSDNVIRSIPSAGIVIRTPGTYTFAGNILWSPNSVQC